MDGTAPTAIPGSTSDAAGGPEIPGPAPVPQFDDDGTTADAMLATAVSLGVAAVITAPVSAPIAAGAAAAAAAAAFIVGSGHEPVMQSAEGGETPFDDDDPADDA